MCDFIFEHRERQRKKHFCLLRCLSAFATPIKLYFRCVFKLLPYVALALAWLRFHAARIYFWEGLIQLDAVIYTEHKCYDNGYAGNRLLECHCTYKVSHHEYSHKNPRSIEPKLYEVNFCRLGIKKNSFGKIMCNVDKIYSGNAHCYKSDNSRCGGLKKTCLRDEYGKLHDDVSHGHLFERFVCNFEVIVLIVHKWFYPEKE